jgi:hypothetical protein
MRGGADSARRTIEEAGILEIRHPTKIKLPSALASLAPESAAQRPRRQPLNVDMEGHVKQRESWRGGRGVFDDESC